MSNAAEEEEAAAAAVEEVGDMCIWMRMRMAAIKCAAANAPSFDVSFLVPPLQKAPNDSGEQCGMGLLRNRRGR